MKCGPTKKVCFKTHEAALTRAGEILNDDRRQSKAKTFRAYKCIYCGQYHLTAQPADFA